MWSLQLANSGTASTRDFKSLADFRAQLFASLPKQSLVLHARECWSEGQYDVRPSQRATEIWRLGRADPRRALISPAAPYMPWKTGKIDVKTSIGRRTNTQGPGTTTARASKMLSRDSGT